MSTSSEEGFAIRRLSPAARERFAMWNRDEELQNAHHEIASLKAARVRDHAHAIDLARDNALLRDRVQYLMNLCEECRCWTCGSDGSSEHTQ